jgi:hypothetical protein
MISKTAYKNYIEPIIVFLPIILLCLAMQYKTSNYSRFPEWYKMSTVIQQVFASGVENTLLFVGNSYTQSAVRPKEIAKQQPLPVYILARGNTPGVELMLWLYKHQIYPKSLLIELNARQLSPQYFADFDILKPNSSNSFDLFKNKTEILLRYYIENYFTYLTYKVSPKDTLYELYNSKSLLVGLKNLFISKNAKHPEAAFSPEGYTYIPENSKSFNVSKRTAKYVIDYSKRVGISFPNVPPTLTLWEFLIDKFQKHNTNIVMIRLPKNKKMIDIENKIAPEYFSKLKSIALQNNIPFIDLTSSDNMKKFSSFFLDGGHWSNKGAEKISHLIRKKLLKNKILPHSVNLKQNGAL